MYSISKNFKFEAAHRLLSMPEGHPCRNFHGHSYVVKVTVSIKDISSLPNSNMIIDFGKLKEFQKWLDENFDHSTILNKDDAALFAILKSNNNKVRTMPFGDPTAERMAKFFWLIVRDICVPLLPKPFNIKIEVSETVGNIGAYEEVVE